MYIYNIIYIYKYNMYIYIYVYIYIYIYITYNTKNPSLKKWTLLKSNIFT